MHKATYDDRVEVQQKGDDWVLVHVVTAYWKNESLDIYEEDENGNCRCRNLYFNSYAGYVVAFPGLPYDNYYYGDEIADVEEWTIFKRHEFYCPRKYMSESEKDKLLALHPNFTYVLQKWNNATINNIMRILPLWKKNPEVELLLAAGFEKIAFNKSFYKLKKENKKKIINWIIKHPSMREFTLQQIQIVVKNNLNADEYSEYVDFLNAVPFCHNCKYETFNYLKKHNMQDTQNYLLYRDYIQLLKQTNHNIKDKYWLYPKNLSEAHFKVLSEIDREKALKQKEEREILAKNMKDITTRASKFNAKINGFSIFVTNDISVWNEQANKLHQCIIRCNYMEHVAKGNSIIVFIQKDGEPVATAEIYKDLTLGQFYANEISHSAETSKPTKDVQIAFDKYFATLDKSIFKKSKVVENA